MADGLLSTVPLLFSRSVHRKRFLCFFFCRFHLSNRIQACDKPVSKPGMSSVYRKDAKSACWGCKIPPLVLPLFPFLCFLGFRKSSNHRAAYAFAGGGWLGHGELSRRFLRGAAGFGVAGQGCSSGRSQKMTKPGRTSGTRVEWIG